MESPKLELPRIAHSRYLLWRRWAYVLALILSLFAVLIRMQLPNVFGDRPLLILFLFPVIVSALLGGLGPGLLATGASAILSDYFLLAPTQSLMIGSEYDLMQWLMLIANGVLVSLMSEYLLRSQRRETARWQQLLETRDKLHFSEALFQATFEQAAIGLSLLSPEGRWLKVNHRFCEIVGYSAAELLTRHFADITHPEHHASDRDCMQRMLAGEMDKCSAEKRFIRKDGSIGWISVNAYLVYKADGAPDYFIATIEDIEQRKQAVKALSKSEEALKVAQRLTGLGSWSWDLRTDQMTWSEQTYQLYDLDPSLPPADYQQVQAYFTPDSWRSLAAAVAKARSEGLAYECELEMQGPIESRRWLCARGEALRDEQGCIVILQGTLQDITQRKHAELSLRNAQQTALEAQRQARMAALNLMEDAVTARLNVEAANDALRRSEEFKRAIFDSVNANIAVLDRQGVIVAVNQPWQDFARQNKLEGGAITLYSSVGSNYLAVCRDAIGTNAGDAPQIKDGIQAVLEGSLERFVCEYPCHSPSEQRWFSMVATPLDTGEGGVVVSHTDTTERKLTELALAESEERLRLAQSSANIGIWDWHIASDTLQCTAELNAMLGYAPHAGTANYSTFAQRVYPDDLPDLELHRDEAIAARRSFDLDFRVQPQPGVIRWLNSKGGAEYDLQGRPQRVFGVCIDITERKQTEQQLRKLAQAVEQSPASIIITNLQGEIEYVNQAFTQISGYSREEVLGKNPSILKSGKTPPQNIAGVWKALGQGLTWKGEFINKRKDGSEYVDFAILIPIRQADGSISHFVAVQDDITEKKRVGLELDQYRHHLEDLVTSRTAELETAKLAADSANQAKSAFLANMSHEIRTPMNAIIGLTYLLRQSAPTGEQSERLDKIDTAAQHLLSIINDVLDLSKIEAGRLELEQTDFALSAVLDHIRSLITEQARTKGLSVEVDGGNVPLWLRGDPTRLRQAMLNYATNAIKFTERGTIHLRARLLADDDAGLLLRFEVKDSGIGIETDRQQSLFQAFTQADVSTTRKYGGTGLGLAITRRLANMMGGDAGVDSKFGEGSTFCFTVRVQRGHGVIPLQTKESVGDAEMQLRHNFAGAHVLLVEDNPINREVAMELLHGVGLAVDTAENGLIAVEKVSNNDYDLVLMDLQMPEMGGLEATRIIREQPNFASLPILAMTAAAFEEDKHICLAGGMNDFVAKPVVPEDLYAALVRWLQRSGRHFGAATLPSQTPLALESNIASPPLPPDLLAIDGFDVAQGLALVNGNVGKYRRLLQLFVDTHGEDMRLFLAGLNIGDYAQLKRLSHGLKGAAGTLGAKRIAELAATLDLALKHNANMADYIDVAKQCDNELIALVNVILALPKPTELSEQNNTSVDPQSLARLVEELNVLLELGDVRAGSLARSSEAMLRKVLGDRYPVFMRQVDVFDYKAAFATLKKAL